MFVTSNGVGWLEAVILGLIQGLTEFLPISSSAHLRIIGPMLPSGLDPGSAFTAITQLGTELAVLVYFRQDIARIFLAWCASFNRNSPSSPDARSDARLGWLVIVGTLPIAVLGLLFSAWALLLSRLRWKEKLLLAFAGIASPLIAAQVSVPEDALRTAMFIYGVPLAMFLTTTGLAAWHQHAHRSRLTAVVLLLAWTFPWLASMMHQPPVQGMHLLWLLLLDVGLLLALCLASLVSAWRAFAKRKQAGRARP